MVFANTDFYQNEYLQGRTEIIPLTEFLFWAEQATQRINRRGMSEDSLIEIFDNCPMDTMTRLGKATCDLAETLYRDETARGTPGEPAKKAESVGGYSVSYSSEKLTTRQINAVTRDTVNSWLFGTSLHNVFVFSGV